MDYNHLELIGRLVKDPVAKKTPSGQSVVTFSVATNYIWTDIKTKEKKENVNFHNVVAWGRLAAICQKYLVKGSKVFVIGRVNNRSWQDRNGNKHYKTEMICSDLIMLDKPKKKPIKEEDLAEENISIEEVPVEDNE
jgi:single-strand DNA-binding protein